MTAIHPTEKAGPVYRTAFFLAADQNYFPYACLAARQIVDTASVSVPGFILQTGVANDMLADSRGVLGKDISVLDVTALMSTWRVNATRLGLATYIRLAADMVADLSGYERLIYVDSDVLFRRSIGDLAGVDLRLPLLAAHDDQQYFDLKYRTRLPLGAGAPYFNAGVLMFNMPLVRERGLLEAARHFAQDHPDLCVQHDQDALNVAFKGQWQTMDPRWNTMTNFSSQIPFERAFARHFSWGKPWQARPLGVEPEALRLYRALAKPTPWADRFGASPSAAGLRFQKKRLGRKFDRVLGILTGKEKLARRSRYEAGRALSLFADHAGKGLAAIRFPEKALGLEANQTAVP